MTQNMTQGKPLKLILLFSLPLLVGNVFQQFYNMADAFIVGRTVGVDALAAVGSTGSVSWLILGFAIGMAAGMSIVTAQRHGAGDAAGVRRSLATMLVISAGVTVILTVGSVFFARDILVLMQTPEEIMDLAYDYIVIIFAGIGASMLFNALSSFMRAVGNSRTPLYFLIIACVLNVVLDYLFILVFDMGTAGVGIATVLAQIVAGLLCLWLLMRSGSSFRLSKADFKVSWSDIREHLRLGIPMGFQNSIISIGAILLQLALNGLGTNAVAAFTAASKIDGIAAMPIHSFGIALSTFVAQNYGAGKLSRIREGVRKTVLVSIAFSLVMGGVNITLGQFMARTFLGVTGEVVELAHTTLVVYGVCYWILALLVLYRYAIQGLGNSLVPTICGGIELVMRGFAGLVLAASVGYIGACFAGPLAWLGAAIPVVIAYFATMRRLTRVPAPQDSELYAMQTQ